MKLVLQYGHRITLLKRITIRGSKIIQSQRTFMLSSDFSCEDEKIKKIPTLHIYDSDKFLISAEISFGTEKKFRYDIGQKVVEKRKSKYYQRIFSPQC
jgi:hypothetical protein